MNQPKGTLALVFVLCSVAATMAQSSAVQPRITQAVDGRMVQLKGNTHPLAQPEFDQGRVSPDMQIHGVSLVFKLSASQHGKLEQLLAEQRDPTSPNYHKWLTPEQYAARFGMSQDDLDKVTSWLQSQGFTGIGVSRSRNEISFDGSAAQIESAFRMEMHHYLVNEEMHFANSTAPAIPAAFADVALALRRLNDFRPKARARRPVAHFTSAQTGNHFITPGDFATIYDLPNNFDGTGVTLVVAGQTQLGTTPTDVSDVNTFRSASGLPANPPQPLLMTGSGTSTLVLSDVDEANLDVEWSGGVAKGATVLYEYVGNAPNFNVFDAWQDAVVNRRGSIVSISYGLCEADFGSQNALAARQVAQQANAQGQTLTAASGDAGAADCDGDSANSVNAATRGLSVDVPAAIPEVTGVGGTEFNGDASSTSTTTYWLGAPSSDTISSARQYIPEMAWNDSPVTGTGTVLSTDLSATGGGVSTLFSKPSWQTGPGVPNDNMRDVPDVSLAGSANHDGFLVCSQGFCTSGFRNGAGGPLDVFGGTSVGSQAFAGILAILNQATHSNGLGNVNPTLYALAANSNTANAFHDVTSGNNIVPCAQGSMNCPMSGALQFGYGAGVGYDLATGLGSVNVANLVTNWTSFTVAGSAASVTASSAGTPTGTSMITVTPSGGFTGQVQVSCLALPPGVTCNPLTITVNGSAPVMEQLTVNLAAFSAPGVTAGVRPATRTEYASLQGGPTGKSGWWKLSAGTGLAAIFLLFLPGRRRNRASMGLWLICLLSFAMGCGGGSSGGGPVAVATTTKITAPPQTRIAPNTALSFPIAVTASGAPAGNGMVQLFFDGVTPGPTVQVTNGAATINTSALGVVGTHAISAHYLGDASTLQSQSGAVNVTVTGTTQVTISTTPPSSSGNVTFNLTIN